LSEVVHSVWHYLHCQSSYSFVQLFYISFNFNEHFNYLSYLYAASAPRERQGFGERPRKSSLSAVEQEHEEQRIDLRGLPIPDNRNRGKTGDRNCAIKAHGQIPACQIDSSPLPGPIK
jgi:hypothetical protein